MQTKQHEQTASGWVHDYSDALYAYTVHRVTDTTIAKDLVQETFIAAWRSIDSYSGKASVKTWLFTILKNKIIDHYRKASTHFSQQITLIAENDAYYFESDGHWTDNAGPADWTNSASKGIETKEFHSILNKCRSKLKEIQNAVFSLKYLDDMESEEICKVLEISSSNYWVLIHRAKVQLRACLEKNWFAR